MAQSEDIHVLHVSYSRLRLWKTYVYMWHHGGHLWRFIGGLCYKKVYETWLIRWIISVKRCNYRAIMYSALFLIRSPLNEIWNLVSMASQLKIMWMGFGMFPWKATRPWRNWKPDGITVIAVPSQIPRVAKLPICEWHIRTCIFSRRSSHSRGKLF